MKLKLIGLTPAVTFAFATAAAAESQPATSTQTTTTQTQPTTSESQSPTTTQTTAPTQQTTSGPSAADQPATAQAGQGTQATAVATAADIKAGASVYDQTGASVGKVDSVDADGAIVNTGEVRAEIPFSSFGKNDKGLVVSVTKADLEAQGKKETKKETKPKS